MEYLGSIKSTANDAASDMLKLAQMNCKRHEVAGVTQTQILLNMMVYWVLS